MPDCVEQSEAQNERGRTAPPTRVNSMDSVAVDPGLEMFGGPVSTCRGMMFVDVC